MEAVCGEVCELPVATLESEPANLAAKNVRKRTFRCSALAFLDFEEPKRDTRREQTHAT